MIPIRKPTATVFLIKNVMTSNTIDTAIWIVTANAGLKPKYGMAKSHINVTKRGRRINPIKNSTVFPIIPIY